VDDDHPSQTAGGSAGHGPGLAVLYSFPHVLGSPGIGTTAWHQVSQLIAKGHRVTVVTARLAKPVPGAAAVVETLVVAGQRIPHRIVGRGRAMRYHDLRTRAAVRRGRFDVVHVWPESGAITLAEAAVRRVPGVRESPNTHTAHAYDVVGRESARIGLELAKDNPHRFNAARLSREAVELQRATGVLVPAESVAATYREMGFPDEVLLRHRYGYDPEVFGGGAPAERAPGGLRAVFVGRCEPRKGLHHALAAWRNSTAAATGTFTVYGSFIPGYRELLGDLLTQPSVRIGGFTSDVRSIYAGADVLLLPTVEEGSALVVYEAMASGCVPLVSEAAGAWSVDGESGLLHEVGDVAALTGQLDRLSADPAELQRLSTGARAAAAHLTWSDAVDALVDAYRAAIRLVSAPLTTGPR
jgi:glycosyltransferase involved in cell wall biosynthesis